jgi:hypothetical protein
MNHLIDWVDAAGRIWGHTRRRLDLKLEPWPQSVGARIQDGIPPESFVAPRYPEVFTGEALRFNLAFQRLSERHRRRIYVHYVIALPAKQKIAILHVSRASYYAYLATCHRRIANHLEYG